MASRDESSVSRKQSSDGADEISTFNAENMQNNAKIINYSRIFMSIIGGVVAGILGFTGLTGFIFYFLVMAITSVGIAAKAGFSVLPYFDSWNQILINGFLGGLLSFVLFWTLGAVKWSFMLLMCVELTLSLGSNEGITDKEKICLRLRAYFLKSPGDYCQSITLQ